MKKKKIEEIKEIIPIYKVGDSVIVIFLGKKYNCKVIDINRENRYLCESDTGTRFPDATADPNDNSPFKIQQN